MNTEALVQAVGDYARALLTDYDIGTVLYRLTDHVTNVLGTDGAGVSLADDGPHLAFVAATDGNVAAVEEAQEAQREGPCHEAYRSGDPVAVVDLEQEERWPAYRQTALQVGVRAVLGVPMPVAERRIGARTSTGRRPTSGTTRNSRSRGRWPTWPRATCSTVVGWRTRAR